MSETNSPFSSIGTGLMWIIVATLLLLGAIVASMVLVFTGDAANTAQREFAASALLKKYEWFQDAAAALDEKRSSIEVYESRLKNLSGAYAGKPRSEWTPEDREQYNLWIQESSGVKLSYNRLASEYNAQMSKINWRFTNRGDLPAGADRPLPREYRAYISK